MKPSYFIQIEKTHIGFAYQITILALENQFHTELKINIVYNMMKTVKYMA